MNQTHITITGQRHDVTGEHAFLITVNNGEEEIETEDHLINALEGKFVYFSKIIRIQKLPLNQWKVVCSI